MAQAGETNKARELSSGAHFFKKKEKKKRKKKERLAYRTRKRRGREILFTLLHYSHVALMGSLSSSTHAIDESRSRRSSREPFMLNLSSSFRSFLVGQITRILIH